MAVSNQKKCIIFDNEQLTADFPCILKTRFWIIKIEI
jgi:hypothetical protein